MSGFANDYKPFYIDISPTTHITQLEGYYEGKIAFGDHFTVQYRGKSYHHGWLRNRITGNLYFHSDIGRPFTPQIVNDIFQQMRQNMGEPKLSTPVAGWKSRKGSKKSLKYKKKSRKASKKSLKYKKKSRKASKKSLKYKKKSRKHSKRIRK
jgi:hypothetical protein